MNPGAPPEPPTNVSFCTPTQCRSAQAVAVSEATWSRVGVRHTLQQAVVEHSSGPRSFHMGGADKVSIKAQVVFDTCWRKLEDSLQAIGKVPSDVQPHPTLHLCC